MAVPNKKSSCSLEDLIPSSLSFISSMESIPITCYSAALFFLAVYCWWRKPLSNWLHNNSNKDDLKNERTPLKGRTKSVIAKFETLEANNKKNRNSYSNGTLTPGKTKNSNANQQQQSTKEKERTSLVSYVWSLFFRRHHKVSPDETQPLIPTKKKELIARCPACRTRLAPSDKTLAYQQLTLHSKCFFCRDCKGSLVPSLQNEEKETATKNIEQYDANGKVQFRCATCSAISEYDKPRQLSQEAGTRIVVAPHEYGDTEQVRKDIGDDLEQAVYFMTPRCAVCGGDFFHDKNADDVKVEGRTVYHLHCYETGQPSTALAQVSTKLPPSFCAKYLPQQIILKLNRSNKKNNNGVATLTTLYFVWKDRENHVIQLRQENAAIVVVPFSLDEQAPANPNYSASLERNNNKKQRCTQIPLPSMKTAVDELQLELVTGIEVPPRCPTMIEPVSIQQQDNSAVEEDMSCLCAKLAYLKFGLQYVLELQIPCTMDEPSNNQLLDLVGATLSVTIQDRSRYLMGWDRNQ